MFLRFNTISSVTAFLAISFFATTASASPTAQTKPDTAKNCPGYVHIYPQDAVERPRICQAVQQIEDFYADLGFAAPEQELHIHLTANFPSWMNKKCNVNSRNSYGTVDGRNHHIYLLTEQEFMAHEQKVLFDIPNNIHLYNSVLVHEISHVIAEQLYQGKEVELPKEHAEALAYIVQFENMHPLTRERVLDKFDAYLLKYNMQYRFAGRKDATSFWQFYFNVYGFALKSYYYFLGDDGPALARDMILGNVPMDEDTRPYRKPCR